MRKNKIKYLLVLVATFIVILFLIDNSNIILKLSYPIKYDELVSKYATKNELDPYMVYSVIKAESSFNPNALSPRNARGLMQISEKTGKWGADDMKLKDFTVEKLYDPETNICIGCWYLLKLKKQFKGNMDLALAAYNGGSGNVSQWIQNKSISSSENNLDKIPFKETKNYVKKVKNFYQVYKNLYDKSLK